MLATAPVTPPNEGLPGPACFVAVEGVTLECDRGTAGCFVDHDPLSPEEAAEPVEDPYSVLRWSRF